MVRTLVAAGDCLVPIGDINSGDLVWATDTEKHVVGMVGAETLVRMTLPAFIIGGVGGGIYGRISSYFNPNGDFIGF